MFIEFADVVELRGNLPNKQLGVRRELSSFVEALVVGFVKVGFVKPGFLGQQASIMADTRPLPGFRFHDDSHVVVGDLFSMWLVHLPHCKANQVGSLGIDSVSVDWPGSDAGSLGIIHI